MRQGYWDRGPDSFTVPLHKTHPARGCGRDVGSFSPFIRRGGPDKYVGGGILDAPGRRRITNVRGRMLSAPTAWTGVFPLQGRMRVSGGRDAEGGVPYDVVGRWRVGRRFRMSGGRLDQRIEPCAKDGSFTVPLR